MSQAITELWNGNIAPVEHCGEHDPAVNRLFSLMEQTGERLRRDLTDIQKDIFSKYMECSEDYLLRMMELAFTEGFTLGTRLMMESLT